MPPHLGGLEVVAATLCDRYTAAGCDVRWIASRVPVEAIPDDSRHIRVNCVNWFEQWLGVPWPVWGPGGWREVARLVAWADVVHIHDCLYFGSALTTLLARRAKKPVLLSQHIGFVSYRSPVLRAIERLAYATVGRAVVLRASHVVFCTPAAEEFVTALVNKRSLVTSAIPYGIDTNRYRPSTSADQAAARTTLGLSASGQVILFTGRLVEKKGVDLFLEVQTRTPTSHFLLVGDGPMRPQPAENLTWIPFVPPDQMDLVYRAADVLLLPSHSEGFPLSILEALASGLPVITSTGQAFATRLEQEGACLLAQRTPEAFCTALSRLLEHPELARTLGHRARELVVREWGLEAMGTRYLLLLHQLTAKTS